MGSFRIKKDNNQIGPKNLRDSKHIYLGYIVQHLLFHKHESNVGSIFLESASAVLRLYLLPSLACYYRDRIYNTDP